MLSQADRLADLSPYTSPVSGMFVPPAAMLRASVKLSGWFEAMAWKMKPPQAQVVLATTDWMHSLAFRAFARLEAQRDEERRAEERRAQEALLAATTREDE